MAANIGSSINTGSVGSRCRVELFVSYAHQDHKFKTNLVKHLSVLERENLISIWYDRDVGPGEEWRGQIDCHLNTAAIILLLISNHFLSSTYCRDLEVKRALQRHENGEARVIPVIVRPVVWGADREISKLQALPTNARAVIKWTVQDDAYVDITKGIIQVIQDLTTKAALPSPLPSSQTSSTPEQEALVEAEIEEDSGYVYAIGKIEPRFPSLGIEKEFRQASARHDGAAAVDGKTMYGFLADPRNRYLARELCWVLTKESHSYLLFPSDPNDRCLLVESLRANPQADDLDLVIGVQGTPGACGATTMPTIFFDQIYSFDVASLLSSIPLPTGLNEVEFRPVAEELLRFLIATAQNGCGGDEDRALLYLAVRYAALYSLAAQAAVRGLRLNAVEVSRLPVSSEGRRIVNVFFSYASSKASKRERYLVAVDVTDKYPFLANELSRCKDQMSSDSKRKSPAR